MGKTPVGVLNGNFRNRDYFFYAQALRNPYNRITEQMMNKKNLRNSYWLQRRSNAVQVLKTADPQGWERWYDNDANVPAEFTNREQSKLIEARVRELTGSYPVIKTKMVRNIFIWTDDYGSFVFTKEAGKDKPLSVFEFVSIETAEAFIKGLPQNNCGQGNVVDLLPAPFAFATVESE